MYYPLNDISTLLDNNIIPTSVLGDPDLETNGGAGCTGADSIMTGIMTEVDGGDVVRVKSILCSQLNYTYE